MNATTISGMHPYPTSRVGGLFLVIIGFTMIVATLLGRALVVHPGLFFLGSVAGVLLNPRVRARLAFGQPSKRQRQAMTVAFMLEGVLLGLDAIGFEWPYSSSQTIPQTCRRGRRRCTKGRPVVSGSIVSGCG